MYEKFTDRARKVMQLANAEAQRFNHEYIGTEHILLGLVKEGTGVGANVLKNFGIDLQKIRLEVEKIVQAGPDTVPMDWKLPMTPRAKKVIEYAIEEAKMLSHNYVGTEHLLLGLLRETEGLAAQVLLNLGLSLRSIQQEVLALLGRVPLKEMTKDFLPSPVLSDLPGAAHPQVLPGLPEAARHVLQELNEQIERLTQEKENAVADMDFNNARNLRDQASKLIQVREFFLNQWSEPKKPQPE